MAEELLRLSDELLKQLSGDVRYLKMIITGNGDPSKGVIVRLDRIEQHGRMVAWFAGIVAVLLSGVGYRLIFGH